MSQSVIMTTYAGIVQWLRMPAFQAGDESSILSTRTMFALVAQLDRAEDF